MDSSSFRMSFEKPSTWLMIVVVLMVYTVTLKVSGNDTWSAFGMAAIVTGVFGRIWTMGEMEGIEKWFRRALLLPSAVLFLPALGHQLRSGPDGRPTTMLGHLVATGWALFEDVRHNLAKPPPLKASIESKSEFLGAVTTNFLILTSLSDKGLFPTTCSIHSGSEFYAVSLPDVIKPYDTVNVELKTKQGRIHFKTGDRIVIECKDYEKPLIVLGK